MRQIYNSLSNRRWRGIVPLFLFLTPLLYLLTLARGLVYGDPTEYTFVAYILGIAHPPGYAFYTLVGKLFQTLVPINDIPWRMHLLSAVAATITTIFTYLTIRRLGRIRGIAYSDLVALLAALAIGLATDFWQHAIHANPHIVTATFLSANLFIISSWWATLNDSNSIRNRGDRWIYIFSFTSGLGITHHPLAAISLPAFLIFILFNRPQILKMRKTLLSAIFFGMLGLAVWLYLPIRSPMEPLFGPSNLNTIDGFLNHVLARGLTESLPFFSLVELPDRALVFWSLLRLQYSLPIIFLALLGIFWGSLRGTEESNSRPHRLVAMLSAWSRQPSCLFSLVFLFNYAFVMSLRQQDIMAYLLGPFMIVGLLSGTGLLAFFDLIQHRLHTTTRSVELLIGAMLLLGPLLQLLHNLPQISLAQNDDAGDYLEAVSAWFEGRGAGATLLNDWEHMTPLWYRQFVAGNSFDQGDVTPRLVSADRPWLLSVFDFLPGGPVYLSGYRSEIVQAGFRLRPRSVFYEVTEPGNQEIPPELDLVAKLVGSPLQVVAYQLPRRSVEAGDFVPLVLAMKLTEKSESYFTPVLYIGSGPNRISYEFTTDSHLVTPLWLEGEVIVERFDFALPWDLSSGSYPVALTLRNLTTGGDLEPELSLGELAVVNPNPERNFGPVLANFRQRVGLVSATVNNGIWRQRDAPWLEPLAADKGDVLQLILEWKSLGPAEESYTVFVHLIDQSNRPLVTLDYTPLGGSTPTYLWIPKWLPGQQMLDPYRLRIPEDLEPGTYIIEVGLYEMTGGRRLHISDVNGNLTGDRYILGSVQVGRSR